VFETFVVGSLPRPQWVRDVIDDRRDGRLSPAEADALLDAAIPSAVRIQERAGLDVVSDGEWRRESYVKVFSEHVDGFAPGEVQTRIPERRATWRVAPLAQHGPIAARRRVSCARSATRRSSSRCPRRTSSRGGRVSERSRSAYATREGVRSWTRIPILRDELRTLTDERVEHVQIDEPWLLMLVDPLEQERRGVNDLEHEIETCVNAVNAMLDGVDGVTTSLHLCHGHFNRQRATDGGYGPIIDALGKLHVDRCNKFARIRTVPTSPQRPAEGVQPGVIDHCDLHVGRRGSRRSCRGGSSAAPGAADAQPDWVSPRGVNRELD
jgi:5-methyltetrahydropteroyltriglutamate--homocysteine methyltransferase